MKLNEFELNKRFLKIEKHLYLGPIYWNVEEFMKTNEALKCEVGVLEIHLNKLEQDFLADRLRSTASHSEEPWPPLLW